MRQWLERVDLLKQFARDSGKSIPELALLSEKDWLERAQNLDRERSDPRGALDEALRSARGQAKVKFISQLSVAARAYTKANNGQLPSDTRELAPYFIDGGTFKAADVSEAMLARYAMRYTGALSDVPPEESRAIIIEITSPDEEHDQRVVTGPNGSGIRDFVDLRDDTNAAVRAFSNANAGGKPASAAELLPYFKPSLSPFRQNKFLQEFPSLLPR
jgi:hypothetical protein